MKGTDIAILAGVGIVGFGLLKSDFFQGIGKVGTGVGDAAGGLGTGIGFAGEAAGYNLADVFNAVGQLGQSTQTLIRETGTQSSNIVHELGTDLTQATDLTGDVVVDAGGILSDASGSLRSVNKGFWDGFDKTYNLNEPTNIFSTVAGWGGDAFSWVKKQVSPTKSLKSAITGAVIAPTSNSSSTSGSSGSSKSVRSSPSSSQSSASFMESLGYQGTSTLDGVTWTKTPVKLPWQ